MHAFKWPVAADYRVVGGMEIRAVAGEAILYEPLRDPPTLHREFADLEPDEYLLFARQFGILGLGGETEQFSAWDAERKDVKKALSFIDALQGRDWPGWEERLISRRVSATFGTGPRFLRMSRTWVRDALHELLNRKLRVLTCGSFGGKVRPAAILVPASLLGAIWLLIADAASGRSDTITCLHCGQWVKIGKSDGGRRNTSKFCSVRCRVGTYQRRSRFGDALLADGESPDRVAYLAGLSRKAVRRRLRRLGS